MAADLGDGGAVALVVAGGRAHPPVAELARPAQRGGRRPSDPDGQARPLRRLRLHGDGVGVEAGALALDALVAPARTEQADGLVHARATVGEVLAKGVVLGLLPAHADAEADPSARQGVERAHLLGHEHGLPLREHEDLGGQADPLGHGGDVAERHERLQDGHLRRVDRRATGLRGVAHHHVVKHGQVVVADGFDRPRQFDHPGRTLSIRHARKLDGDLHAAILAQGRDRLRCGPGVARPSST